LIKLSSNNSAKLSLIFYSQACRNNNKPFLYQS